MPNRDKKGMILFIVIGIFLVVGILSTVTLRVVTSHSRLTHHQVSRIQALYAAKAGVIYALDKLRRNDDPTCWDPSPALPYTRYIKRSGSGCDIIEPNLPSSVSQVDITVWGPNSGVSGTQKLIAKATYTYTTP